MFRARFPTRVFAFLVGAMFLAPSPAVEAKGRKHKRIKEVLEQLDLSVEQKTKIQSLHESGREEMKVLREKFKTARHAFDEAVRSPDSTDESLGSLHEAFIKAKVETMRAHFSKMLAIRAVLTPEQRKQFATIMEESPRRKFRKKTEESDGK